MSAWLTAANKLRTTRILDVKTASPTVKTFTFKDKQCAKAKPGQFLMLWIPGIDEIPLSILDADKSEATFSVAVKKVGEATQALHNMKVGDIVGVRGPFGNSFTLEKGKALMVGGGVGIAPLAFLAKKVVSKASKTIIILGAKTREELLFIDDFKKLCGEENVLAATEDGSYGVKDLASNLAESVLAKEKFDRVYACGPEQMIRRVFECAENSGVFVEASLERLMRCAIGICGSCVIGEYRVCRDGPVFNSNQLRVFKDELGVWKRDFDGKRIPA
ncbi:MAG: dihydroorotate dehydrogenase electron transfer subunit [Candidatus Bathycorpusculaceae bacterium]